MIKPIPFVKMTTKLTKERRQLSHAQLSTTDEERCGLEKVEPLLMSRGLVNDSRLGHILNWDGAKLELESLFLSGCC